MSYWFQLYREISRLFSHSGYTEVFSLRWNLVKIDPKCRTGTKNLSDFWVYTSSFWDLFITSLVFWGTRAYAIAFAVSLYQQLTSPFAKSNSIWKGNHKANAIWTSNNLGLIGLTYPLAWESKRDLHHPFCTLKAVHQPAGACPCSPVNVQASLKVSHRLAVSYPSAGLRESKGVQLQLPSEGKGRVRQRSQTQRKSGCRDFTNGTTCFIVTQSKSLPMRFYHANIPVISVYENSTSITVY